MWSHFTILPNVCTYGQWRFAGDVLIHRYKTLGGVERLKLPLHPPLAICGVALLIIHLIVQLSHLLTWVND